MPFIKSKFWDVTLSWKDPHMGRPTRAECGAHIAFNEITAANAIDAVRICGEWRSAPLDRLTGIDIELIEVEHYSEVKESD
jgi:hypothetical protein